MNSTIKISIGVHPWVSSTLGVQESFFKTYIMIYILNQNCVHVCVVVWDFKSRIFLVSSELIRMYVDLCNPYVKSLNCDVKCGSYDNHILLILMYKNYVF